MPLYKKKERRNILRLYFRAEDGAQTRDPQLGRLIALNFFEIEITN